MRLSCRIVTVLGWWRERLSRRRTRSMWLMRSCERSLIVGMTVGVRAWTCWTLVYFTLGIVQEEQAVDEPLESILRRGLDADQHSALSCVADHLSSADFDARFEFGLNLILQAKA